MRKISFRQIIDIILILLTLIFVGQNLESVMVRFLFIKFNLPLMIIIAFVFFTGFFTAKVFTGKKGEENMRGKEKVKEHINEVNKEEEEGEEIN
jgi:uncharacterized integral membrane protein